MILVVFILIAMLVACGYFLFHLEEKYEIQEGAGRIVKLIQQAQIAEKAYRKYYEDGYRHTVKKKTQEMLNDLDTNGHIFGPAKHPLIDLIKAYQKSFEEIVALYKLQEEMNDRLNANVESVQSMCLGLSLDTQTRELNPHPGSRPQTVYMAAGQRLALHHIRNMCLRILVHHKRSIISKDEKHLNLLFNYVKTYSPGIFGALELSSETLGDTALQKETADLITTIKDCVTLIRESADLVHAENLKEEQFDLIAQKLTAKADSIHLEAYSAKKRLKTSAAILLVLLISAGILIIVLVTMATNRSITRPLNHMVRTAKAIKEGDLDQTVEIKGDNEFAKLGRAINATTSHLAQSLRLLENEVAERKSAEREIKALSRKMITNQENERASIARELHDELGQMLTLLKIQVSRVFSKGGNHYANQDKSSEEIIDSIDRLMYEVKELALRLRPKILDSMELNEALHWMCKEFTKRTGIECTLSGDVISLDDEVIESTLFRVAQECLTNVTRHSNATHVNIKLYKQGELIEFEISDNGRGCDEVLLNSGKALGIAGMKERARLIGGDLIIQTAPGQGFFLKLIVRLSAFTE